MCALSSKSKIPAKKLPMNFFFFADSKYFTRGDKSPPFPLRYDSDADNNDSKKIIIMKMYVVCK